MAVTPVKLVIDGYKEREVQMVTYEFTQQTDIEGQIAGIPRGGKIVIKVKAMNDGNPELLDWMIQRNLAKKGSIEFSETKSGNLMKKIEFDGAYCVDFDETWEEGLGHLETIVITCQNITFGSVKFENAWK